MTTEAAWAKINLCLHVTGRREDGYHILDSIVVFAGIGDRISAEPSDHFSLSVSGPMAAALSGLEPKDNLVTRAARLIGGDRGVALTLEKHLPPASGIGGGSADAAATFRLLAQVWGAPMPPLDQILTLGADIPVCLMGRPCRMRGIGEDITPITALAPLWLVLVNPGVDLATPQVFRALTSRDNPALPESLPDLSQAADLIHFLKTTRNDLQAPALTIAPVIGDCLTALESRQGCLLSRMSGSGATCFGLFATETAARTALEPIQSAHPDWWAAAAPILV